MKKDYGLESKFVRELDEEILEFVEKGVDDEDEFNRLALKEFELQFYTVKPYREFCLKKGVTPESVSSWEEMPAVPTLAFKKFVLTTFPPEKAVQSYMSSGTTDPLKRSRVYRDARAVRLMTRANEILTRKFLFPDVEKMKILFFAPSPKLVPSMGMAVGLGEVRRIFGNERSKFLISLKGLEVETLLKELRNSEVSGEPVALIGATSAFVYFFNACKKYGIRFRLPEGSRVCDGGGYLGQFGPLTREEFLKLCEEVLGVPSFRCVNVLGMAETSTNYFDNALRNHLLGVVEPRYKVIPPWTRVKVVDPETLEEVEEGRVGLLRHYDLVNRAMIFAVQTDNVGIRVREGFEILGRWRKKRDEVVIEGGFSYPGPRVFGVLTELLLRRGFSRLKRIYDKINREIYSEEVEYGKRT